MVGKECASAYEEYLERLSNKMVGWKAKSLSSAGRVELVVRSALTSMPQFVPSAGWVPKSVLDPTTHAGAK